MRNWRDFKMGQNIVGIPMSHKPEVSNVVNTGGVTEVPDVYTVKSPIIKHPIPVEGVGYQGQLNLGDLKRPEPWQQSQDEHARDPRTMFHATYLAKPSDEDGLHMGTLQAAHDIINLSGIKRDIRKNKPKDLISLRKLPTLPDPANIHALRPDLESISNVPNSPTKDLGSHWLNDLGFDSYGGTKNGTFYHNVSEDPGSISAVVPDRRFAQTWRQSVTGARAEGKQIPPKVLDEYNLTGGEKGPQFHPALSVLHPRQFEANEVNEDYGRGEQMVFPLHKITYGRYDSKSKE